VPDIAGYRQPPPQQTHRPPENGNQFRKLTYQRWRKAFHILPAPNVVWQHLDMITKQQGRSVKKAPIASRRRKKQQADQQHKDKDEVDQPSFKVCVGRQFISLAIL